MSASDQPGDPIHGFSLPASTGQTLGLDSFLGKVPMVIVFVDHESEMDRSLLIELSEHHRDFGAERSQILAVVRSTARDVRELSSDLEITFPVLADANGAMARDFDAEDDDGRLRRVAVVADKAGRLVQRFDSPAVTDNPDGVTETLLQAVRDARSEDDSTTA